MDQLFAESDYEGGDFIGRGAFGVINLYKKKQSDKIVALKYTSLSENNKHGARDEMHFTMDFHGPKFSPFFVQLVARPYMETLQRKDWLFLPLEYCQGGDLVQHLQLLPEAQIQRIIFYVATGLKHMHQRKVAHRDIKAENILATSQNVEEADFKICDFGMARMLKIRKKEEDPDFPIHPSFVRGQSDDGLTHLSSSESVAPEMELGRYDCRVDVWSLGILTKDLAYGRTATIDSSGNIMADKYEHNPEHISLQDERFSEHLNRFISEATSAADVRPDIEALMQLPFLKEWRDRQVSSLLNDGTGLRADLLKRKTKRNWVMKGKNLSEADAYIRETISELDLYRKQATVLSGPDLDSFSSTIDELLGANRFLLTTSF